jgi:transposase
MNGCLLVGWLGTDLCRATVDRGNRLDARIVELAAKSLYEPVVRRLRCLRGVSTLTEVGLAVKIGDWHRLTGRSIGAYLGLVPTESSSGPPGRRARSPRPVTVACGGR